MSTHVQLAPLIADSQPGRRSIAALLPAALILALAAVAILAPTPHNPNTQFADGLRSNGLPLGPSWRFLLGTDQLGRDELSRAIAGARVSLLVGTLGSLIATAIGVAIGLVAGYSKRLTGTLLMRLTDVMMAFPYLLFAVALQAVLGVGVRNLLIVVGALTWVNAARVMNGLALAESERTYVASLRVLGLSRGRILTRHLFPNLAGVALVLFTTGIGYTILLESALSYLGLGVQPPTATWGNMVRDGQSYFQIAPWLTLVPGLVIVAAVTSLNLLGDQLYELWEARR
jgi:ABC-type dipeptide/oligopeptide/nickel transport system permease subunit